MTTSGRSQRRRSQSRRGPRRQTEWNGVTTSPGTVGPGAITFINLVSAYNRAGVAGLLTGLLKGVTFTRLIGTVRLSSTDSLLSADFAMGLIMTTDTADVPDPETEIDRSWLYWDRRSVLPAVAGGQHIPLDVKAQRKFIHADARLLFVIKNTDSAQTLEFITGFRLLYKLN